MTQEKLSRIYKIVSDILNAFPNDKDRVILSLEVTILATRDNTSIDAQIYRQAIEYLKNIKED